MAFDDSALERALRAETKHGLTLYCNGETLTALGYEWMAVVPMDGLRERLRGTLGEEICGYAGETHTEEIRPTGLRMGLNFLMQKRNGEIVGVVPRGANLDVRRYSITPGGIVRQEDGDTGERLYRRGYRPREDTDSEATLRKWRHLEVMSWCDWDAPEE